MLIPQSLAYALLAGLPPERGFMRAIAPTALSVFGTSRALRVGALAVVHLMDCAAALEAISASQVHDAGLCRRSA